MAMQNPLTIGDDKEKLVCMVNDILEGLLDLDMEPGIAMVDEHASS